MNFIQFEIFKLLRRRSLLILLILTTLSFPIILSSILRVSVSSGEISEGLFLPTVAYNIIKFSQLLFFIPLWILVFIGQEFSSRHVNRVVFVKSKPFYFFSKVTYCLIVSVIFSVIGLISLEMALLWSGFRELTVPSFFYLEFFVTILISSFAYSLFLMCLVFIFRSPIAAYIILIVWQVIEGVAFMIFYKLYELKLFWLPIHLVQMIYNKRVEKTEGDYRRLFTEFDPLLLITFVFIVLISYLTYKHFLRSDLKSLSD